MRYFILSQPKAGTYLCANLLQEYGIGFEGLHYTLSKYQHYDLNNLQDCRRDRKKYTKKSPIEESIKLIKDGSFGVGHLGYDERTEKILKDFKKVLLVRDRISSTESWIKWAKVTGKSPNSELITKGKRTSIEFWQSRENVFLLNFNDMIEKNIDRLDQLQQFLFDDVMFDSKKCMQTALSKDSLTKLRN